MRQCTFRLELVVKIAALLILGSLSLVLLTSAMIIVPISLGRAVFSLVMWISAFSIGSNDEINFLVGCYIISDGIVAVRSFINFVGTRRILSVVQLAGKWCMIGLKGFALLSISLRDFSQCNIGAIDKCADLTKKLLVLSDEELRELVCNKVLTMMRDKNNKIASRNQLQALSSA